jgi:hypothetical protein
MERMKCLGDMVLGDTFTEIGYTYSRDNPRQGKFKMNRELYQKYLQQFVAEAIQKSGGSNREIYELLSEMRVKGLLVLHREEKRRALEDAQKAFDEHRHWPLEIILSQLWIENTS